MESGNSNKNETDEDRYANVLGFSKKEEKKRNEEIEKLLKAEKKVLQKQIKLLLLGAGESGKSTIAKQMKILHLQGFNNEEKKAFIRIIRGNVLDSMKILVKENKNLKIGIDSKNEGIAKKVEEAEELKKDIGEYISTLWQDPGIKKTFERSSEFQFYDSAEFFLKNVAKYVDEKYVPDEQDILRSRVRTTGAYETIFVLEGITFRLVDVGGQRSERKKWLSCFTDVTAVIFCVALSEYDQKLAEDLETNRMHESVELFDAIINNKWLRETSMILFLNKRDLFAEKIKRVDLNVCFDDYKDGKNYDKAVDFIRHKFLTKNKQPKRRVYVHVTCATDTDSVAKVWAVVQDILLKEALGQIGVM